MKKAWLYVTIVVCLWLGANFVLVNLDRFDLTQSSTPDFGVPGAPDRRGFLLKSYTDPAGAKHKYVVFVPYNIGELEEPPLLLFLNGFGENGDDGIRQISNNFGRPIWGMRERFTFVAVAPQCTKNGWWDGNGPDTTRALAIMQEVAEEYDTDPDRVYLTGVSSGGVGVWRVAAAHPATFAAIVPLCGPCRFAGNDAKTLADANLPIWHMYNNQDYPPERVTLYRKLNRDLLEAGASPLVTEYPQPGHNCWGIAYQTPELYEWLLEQRRSQNARITETFERMLDGDDLSGWSPYANASWKIDDAGELLCESRDSDSTGFLLSDRSYSDFDLHFEFRMATASECRVAVRSAVDDGERGGLELVVVPPERGSGGIYDSDQHMWIASMDPVGQCACKADDWNDVRIRVSGDRLVVRINGWKTNDVRDERIPGSARRIALLAPTRGATIRWRNIRIRRLD
jgi:pimeloyl-ACP methyl ester carboxylesterase